MLGGLCGVWRHWVCRVDAGCGEHLLRAARVLFAAGLQKGRVLLARALWVGALQE